MEGNFLANFKDWFETIFGKEAQDFKFWQTMLRALIIYIVALVIVRMGKKRLLGKNTAFDVILGIMLGSVFSRAINGNAPFLGTLTAGLLLVVLHWLFSMIAFRKNSFGHLIKGEPRVLVEDGKILWDFDTIKNFETVNGFPGRGGALDGAAPVVSDGMLFVNSGYGSFGQIAGNVLLAFEVAK